MLILAPTVHVNTVLLTWLYRWYDCDVATPSSWYTASHTRSCFGAELCLRSWSTPLVCQPLDITLCTQPAEKIGIHRLVPRPRPALYHFQHWCWLFLCLNALSLNPVVVEDKHRGTKWFVSSFRSGSFTSVGSLLFVGDVETLSLLWFC